MWWARNKAVGCAGVAWVTRKTVKMQLESVSYAWRPTVIVSDILYTMVSNCNQDIKIFPSQTTIILTYYFPCSLPLLCFDYLRVLILKMKKQKDSSDLNHTLAQSLQLHPLCSGIGHRGQNPYFFFLPKKFLMSGGWVFWRSPTKTQVLCINLH